MNCWNTGLLAIECDKVENEKGNEISKKDFAIRSSILKIV